MRSITIYLAAIVSVLMLQSQSVRGADVAADTSVRETIVGLPTVITIRITNANSHDPPEFPEVDGLEIVQAGPPSRGSRVSIINGRRTSSTEVVYRFKITPTRSGTFTVPPIKVRTDGVSRITQAVRIVATEGETDDLLFVEIEGDKPEIYVGESLKLKLKISIRPYRDSATGLRLNEREMWSMIANQESSWGRFQEVIDELNAYRQIPTVRSVLRKDSEGVEREYYQYVLETTVYPNRPGNIDGDDVRIVMSYPMKLGRARSPFSMLGDGFFDDDLFGSPFSGGLRVVESKPLVGTATVEPIRVKPVPTSGRPDDYRGAVGRYSLITEATPESVQVGDPITLLIAIDGDGPLEMVRAPAIESQDDLVRNFKVPDEPLAGFVDGQRKVFTTTIRPLSEDVTEIPGVAFSYFDPEAERFVTTRSDPIAISVEKAERLELDAVVGAPSGFSSESSDDPDSGSDDSAAESRSPLERRLGPEALTPMAPARLFTPAFIAIVFAGPLAAMLALLLRARTSFGRLVPARARLRKALHRSRTPAEIANAVEAYFASRFRLPEGRARRDQALGKLRATGEVGTAIRLERLYHACDQSALSEQSSLVDEFRNQAISLVDGAAESSANGSAIRTAGRVAMLLGCLAASSSAMPNMLAAELTPDQQQALLEEALPIDSDLTGEAKSRRLAESQAKLQLLVDTGIQNDELYFTLASVARANDDLGRAVAYYRKALRFDPYQTRYAQELRRAESELKRDSDDDSLLEAFVAASDWIPVTALKAAWIVAWIVFWGALVARLLRLSLPWKTITGLALLFGTVAGTLYFLNMNEWLRDDVAVLLPEEVIVREGDGEEFEMIRAIKNGTGRTVTWSATRDGWMRIELSDGTVGWVPIDTLVTI